jgi:hypothetical protein
MFIAIAAKTEVQKRSKRGKLLYDLIPESGLKPSEWLFTEVPDLNLKNLCGHEYPRLPVEWVEVTVRKSAAKCTPNDIG